MHTFVKSHPQVANYAVSSITKTGLGRNLSHHQKDSIEAAIGLVQRLVKSRPPSVNKLNRSIKLTNILPILADSRPLPIVFDFQVTEDLGKPDRAVNIRLAKIQLLLVTSETWQNNIQ